MRKRILSFALVLVLMCAMSISVFAGYAFDAGTTYGGTEGMLRCNASLDVDSSRAYATTSSYGGTTGMYSTVATLYCLDSNGDEVPYTDQGNGTVSVYGVPTKGVRGGSHHLVSGGTDYGAWSCTLYANK